MSVNWLVTGKFNVVYTSKGILFDYKREQNLDTRYNSDESWNQYDVWKEWIFPDLFSSLFLPPPPRPICVQVDVKSWHRMPSLIILHLISRSLTKLKFSHLSRWSGQWAPRTLLFPPPPQVWDYWHMPCPCFCRCQGFKLALVASILATESSLLRCQVPLSP